MRREIVALPVQLEQPWARPVGGQTAVRCTGVPIALSGVTTLLNFGFLLIMGLGIAASAGR